MSDLLTKLGFLASASRFKRISDKLQFDGDKIYSDAGIQFKASWFSVYYVLAVAEGPCTILTIADQIGFTHITVKNIVRELLNKGYVDIQPNPNDGRSKWVSLSEEGEELLAKLKPLWSSFSDTLEEVFTAGHEDVLNILDRIDWEISRRPINERVQEPDNPSLQIIDYRPSLRNSFHDLAAPWLLDVLQGTLEEDDKFTLNNPVKAYIEQGGFLFFAKYGEDIVGCVALKRLDEDSFEFAKLFIDPNYRKLGIATKLIARCISRCKENQAVELWLQTTMSMPQAHRLYYKLGFKDREAPLQMGVLKRTEKVMCLEL